MHNVWTDVRVLDAVGKCDRNAIVMGGHVSRLIVPRLLVRPDTNVNAIDDELMQLQFRAWKRSRWDFG
jgi:hypothetical protein